MRGLTNDVRLFVAVVSAQAPGLTTVQELQTEAVLLTTAIALADGSLSRSEKRSLRSLVQELDDPTLESTINNDSSWAREYLVTPSDVFLRMVDADIEDFGGIGSRATTYIRAAVNLANSAAATKPENSDYVEAIIALMENSLVKAETSRYMDRSHDHAMR